MKNASTIAIKPSQRSAMHRIVAAAKEVAEWPEGQEYPPGVWISRGLPGYATNGLGLPIIGLRI